MLLKPIVARADTSAADGLVTAVESLQMKSIVGPSAPAEELKRYGLDKPSAVVNLHAARTGLRLPLAGRPGKTRSTRGTLPSRTCARSRRLRRTT